MINKYRKKPVVIEATKYDGSSQSIADISEFVGEDLTIKTSTDDSMVIHTLEGDMVASVGDFIIKGVNGELYPCKPDIFEKTYTEEGGPMPFGLAIEAMKAGKKVARAGWNGKGMWLRVVYPYMDKQFLVIEGEFCEGTLLPYIGMKTADNGFVPWLASQTDMLSEDWMIVE